MFILRNIIVAGIVSLLFSCTSASYKSETRKPAKIIESDQNLSNQSLISLEELLLDDLPVKIEIIEVSKDNVYEKCEKVLSEILVYYNNGDLQNARILFDILIDQLELLHLEEKVSDRKMLTDFSAHRNRKMNNSFNDNSLTDIYENLYSEDFNLAQNKNDKTLIESVDRKTNVKQNNKEYLYLKGKIDAIYTDYKIDKPNEPFVKQVYEAYDDYLEDRISLKEIYFRYKKYDEFLSRTLKKENLPEVFKYIPGIMTTYYIGKNNGGIWRISNDRSIRKIRDDIGASTAYVVKLLKSNSKKNSPLTQIAAIVTKREYNLKNQDLKFADFQSSEFARFLALSVILMNPKDHKLSLPGKLTTHTSQYVKSYNSYMENPAKYVSSKPSRKKTSYSSKSITIKYIIQPGDYLSKVAKLFRCKISDIKRWNPRSTRNNKLYRGTPLYIKSSRLMKYKASSGDHLSKICSKFNMNQSNFMKINNLKSKKIYRNRTYIVFRK